MLEKEIEKEVCDYARKKYGAMAYKFTSPARRNVPDRIIIFPSGRIIFIEFKATGKKTTSGQNREIARLRNREQTVYIVDTVDDGICIIDQEARG